MGIRLYNSTVIPNRGAWIELETDANDIVYARIDRNRKIPVTVLIRALGWSSNADILELFFDDKRLKATFEKDTTENQDEALVEIYKKLRPGEPPTVESARNLFEGLSSTRAVMIWPALAVTKPARSSAGNAASLA